MKPLKCRDCRSFSLVPITFRGYCRLKNKEITAEEEESFPDWCPHSFLPENERNFVEKFLYFLGESVILGLIGCYMVLSLLVCFIMSFAYVYVMITSPEDVIPATVLLLSLGVSLRIYLYLIGLHIPSKKDSGISE